MARICYWQTVSIAPAVSGAVVPPQLDPFLPAPTFLEIAGTFWEIART